jgi:hypothetical protein
MILVRSDPASPPDHGYLTPAARAVESYGSLIFLQRDRCLVFACGGGIGGMGNRLVQESGSKLKDRRHVDFSGICGCLLFCGIPPFGISRGNRRASDRRCFKFGDIKRELCTKYCTSSSRAHSSIPCPSVLPVLPLSLMTRKKPSKYHNLSITLLTDDYTLKNKSPPRRLRSLRYGTLISSTQA